MRTIRLRFADEAAARDTLKAAGWLATDPETGAETVPPLVWVSGARCDIDMIGVLHEAADADAQPVALPGWHINLLWWGDGTAPAIGGETVEPEAALREWLV
ncbi:hypothetical protein [Pleomorphomonas koreensis]|uniref:hypothetical protein n=1 Tax=Pleomorphomonas koreensis TaxID=257440 RepID=UPI00047D6679|nr:hypothetical protein [Pleomorphomonas koreensis]